MIWIILSGAFLLMLGAVAFMLVLIAATGAGETTSAGGRVGWIATLF